MSAPEIRYRPDGIIFVDWGNVRFATDAKGARELIDGLEAALKTMPPTDLLRPEHEKALARSGRELSGAVCDPQIESPHRKR